MLRFGAKWHSPVKIEKQGLIEEVGRNTTKITIGSHCGTHIDSPAHFIKYGRTIDKINLLELIGKVSILDFSSLKEDECVTVEMLKHLDIREKVIFNFNWAKNFYVSAEKFYNHHPYFSDEAAEYLINKGVKLIGMDTPSPDDSRIKLGSLEDSKIHKKFLSNKVILIEYLNNLDKIDNQNNWTLIAMPLKIRDCDVSSARISIIIRRYKIVKDWLIQWFLEHSTVDRNEIEQKILENYFNNGWLDSLNFINFISDLEEHFSISFSNDEFQNREFSTIDGINFLKVK